MPGMNWKGDASGALCKLPWVTQVGRNELFHMGNELPKPGTYFHFLCVSTAVLRADSLLKVGKNLQMEFVIFFLFFFFPERGVNFVSHRKWFCNRSQVIWHAQA